MNYANSQIKRKNKVIKQQLDEIDRLQKLVSKLEISCEEKDTIVHSIDFLRKNLIETINDAKAKSREFDRLMRELIEMKQVMNQTVFKGRWKLIRLLMK